jgi:RNA polymerase sigma-B factor
VSASHIPLSRPGADEGRLFDRYVRDGDIAARDALVARYLPLARHLARRFGRDSTQAEDLVQVASLGLLKAIERFDPGRGLAFSSFATPTIVGELKRYFRDKAWAVHVPRDLQEMAVRVRRSADDLESELGRAPTAAELAERVGGSIEDVLEAREAASAQQCLSLSRPAGGADDDEQTLGDTLATEDHALSRAEDTAMIDDLVKHLGDRERTILRLRFHDDLTQSEIGRQLGISQMHVSRLLRQSITRLRILAQDAGTNA